MRRALLTATALVVATALVAPDLRAEPKEVRARKLKQQTAFSDQEIIGGYLKVAFGAEMSANPALSDRIRKYVLPVRVFVDNRAKPNRSAMVAMVLADIAARVRGLDLAIVTESTNANVNVRLVRDRDFGRTIRSLYGEARGRRILKSLEPQCISSFRKNSAFEIVASQIVLVADVREFTLLDCAYEEILQGLGPINDDSSIPWTMFNDDVRMGFFGVYDQLLLNIHYHPRIQPGMTREQVKALMPEILPEVRRFVASKNGLSH